MTRFCLFLAAAFAVAVTPSLASDWVHITKPADACEAGEDALPWRPNSLPFEPTGAREEGCEPLKVGDKLQFDR